MDRAKRLASCVLIAFTGCAAPRPVVSAAPPAIPDDPCAYFPPPSLEPTFACWFGQCLKTMREPSAATLESGPPFVRLLWLRSFHRAVVVRLTRSADGAEVEAKRLHGPECTSELEDREHAISISSEAAEGVFAALNRGGFWSATPPAAREAGVDGAQWIFEAFDGERYRMQHYWTDDMAANPPTPAHGELRNAALLLLELGGMKPRDPEEIY